MKEEPLDYELAKPKKEPIDYRKRANGYYIIMAIGGVILTWMTTKENALDTSVLSNSPDTV